MGYVRSHLWGSLCLMGALLSFSWGDTTYNLAPGVDYFKWVQPTPNVINAVRYNRAYKEYDLELGFAKGQRDYSYKAPVSQIVPYYNYSGHTVIVAVNAAFFGTDLDITGSVANNGNLIQIPNNSRDTFTMTRGHVPLIVNGISNSGCKVYFANGLSTTIDLLNLDRDTNTITCYTPDWAARTGSSVQGVEVIVNNVTYPLRPDKTVTGVVSAIRKGAESTNNAIPANGLVLSARDQATTVLINNMNVGDRVNFNFNLSPNSLGMAKLMSTGLGWLMVNGSANTTDWYTHDSAGFWGVRHPRSVVAWNDQYIWLLTIDGRQSGYSVGMTFQEMVNFLTSIGARDALNMDGGGSTTMVLNGTLVNCPSDNATTPCTGTERAVPTAMMIVRQEKRSSFPLTDTFAASGRTLAWDDRALYNQVTAFAPTAPGGDGYVMTIKPASGFETALLGKRMDENYFVEAQVFCEYRNDIGAGQYERVGIFARDDGHGNFDAASSANTITGGNCYFISYDTDTGRIRMGKMVNGVMTEFAAGTPVFINVTGWHKFKIYCMENQISYFLDEEPVLTVTDNSHSSGYFGLGYKENYTTNSNAHGGVFENFRADQALTSASNWTQAE